MRPILYHIYDDVHLLEEAFTEMDPEKAREIVSKDIHIKTLII